MRVSTDTVRILEPMKGVFAYYDGRIAGRRLWSEQPNWLDDGAYCLGVASYAIVDGGEALVYDSGISLEHASLIRTHLSELGVTTITLALSHSHKDHVAGNSIFADCKILGSRKTAVRLETDRAQLESASPAISPVVGPNLIVDGTLKVEVGSIKIELQQYEIHSSDGLVLWLPKLRCLFAGDTLEDPIPYVAEAERIPVHIRELDRLNNLPIHRIFPSHGSEATILAGGYSKGLIEANRCYLQWLIGRTATSLGIHLEELISSHSGIEAVSYFEPYEAVHKANLRSCQKESG